MHVNTHTFTDIHDSPSMDGDFESKGWVEFIYASDLDQNLAPVDLY